jgi:hypothetical protein
MTRDQLIERRRLWPVLLVTSACAGGVPVTHSRATARPVPDGVSRASSSSCTWPPMATPRPPPTPACQATPATHTRCEATRHRAAKPRASHYNALPSTALRSHARAVTSQESEHNPDAGLETGEILQPAPCTPNLPPPNGAAT